MKQEKNDLSRSPQMRGGNPHEPKLIASHTVTEGQTLSDIALKYYKHATPPYWKVILEHNERILKGDEKNLRTSMELEIPELPETLKD
jgi:nucleoid-associated protein YgaU